jgi:hypothetical protein
MTIVPSPDGMDPAPFDEASVARLANQIFRESPALAGYGATQAEDLDGVPGHVGNVATDGAALAASRAYRIDPTFTKSIPFGSVPHAAPGALGIGASSPSSFLLRSAPMGHVTPHRRANSGRRPRAPGTTSTSCAVTFRSSTSESTASASYGSTTRRRLRSHSA